MRKKYRNLRKAAVLLASLDADNVEAILREMTPEQADALRRAVDRLGEVDPAEQEEVIEEFFRVGSLCPDKQPAGIELDGHVPEHLLLPPKEEPQEAPQPIVTRAGTPLAFLRDAAPRSLAPFLEREHPQTIAVVVSHLPSHRAAELLSVLPAELQIEVARRLVNLEQTDPETLQALELGLETWLCEQVQSPGRRTAGLAALNNILDAASPAARQHIMTNLTRHDRQLANQVKKPAPQAQPAPRFSDLDTFDSASLTVVLHHAEAEVLVLALAGASPQFADRVFELFPPTEVGLLRAALNHLGPTRLSDVEEAQQQLAELARQLESRGEIAPEARGRLSVAV